MWVTVSSRLISQPPVSPQQLPRAKTASPAPEDGQLPSPFPGVWRHFVFLRQHLLSLWAPALLRTEPPSSISPFLPGWLTGCQLVTLSTLGSQAVHP